MTNDGKAWRRSTAAALLAALLAVTACGGGDDDPTVAPDVAQDDGTDGDAGDGEGAATPEAEIATTPVMVPFERFGQFDAQRNRIDPPTDIPVQPGELAAHWYRSGTQWAVVYAGWDHDELGAFCPGNSMEVTDGQFESVSNDPTEEGSCPPDVTADKHPQTGRGVKVCDGLVIYETDVALDAQGELLWASFVAPIAGGGWWSSASWVPPDADNAPELDYDAGSYTIPAELLDGSTTEVTC